MSAWVITKNVTPPSGTPVTVYWNGGGFSLGGATWAKLGPPNGLGTIRTFPTKQDALADFRKRHGHCEGRAVQLSAEDAALIRGDTVPDANTTSAQQSQPAPPTQEPLPQRPESPPEPPTSRPAGDDTMVPPNTESGRDDVIPALDADEARALTDEIRHDVENLWDKIVRAYHGRAWVALGYDSWDVYCIKDFGDSRLRLPREERPEMVASLRQAGLSIRAIASATGTGVGTIHREIEASAAARAMGGVPFGTPARLVDQQQIGDADQQAEELITADRIITDRLTDRIAEVIRIQPTEAPPIIGTDGKTYRLQRKPAPKPDPLPPQWRNDNAMLFVIQVRSTARNLDTLMGFAETLDADAKRKVLDKHREDLERCVAKMAAIVEQFAAVDGSDEVGTSHD